MSILPPKQLKGILESKIDHLSWVMNVLVFVLFIGFAAMFVATASMLIDSWKFKQGTYQNLIDKVNAQSSSLTEQNKKIDGIRGQVDRIPKSN